AFKLMGVPFYDEQGEPLMVMPDMTTSPPGNWNGVNNLVIQELENINPDFPIEDEGLDLRTRIPSPDAFTIDNSVNPTPDDEIDLTFIIYRYNPDWSTQPITNMDNWAGSQGGQVASYNGAIELNNHKFGKGAIITSSKSVSNINLVFLHELAHVLMEGSHQMGANGDYGEYLSPLTCGWGTMGSSTPIFYPMLNSWERWWNGYIDPPTITPEDNDIEIWLRDYITTGDAIRVQDPFSNLSNDGEYQYLWIENHTGKSNFDQKPNAEYNLTINGQLIGVFPDSDHGVYMFVDDMNESREEPNGNENGLKPINASGNWNFTMNESEFYTNNNGKPFLFQFELDEENIIGGISPWLKYNYNIPDDPNEVLYFLTEVASIDRELVNDNNEFLFRSLGGFDSDFN